MARFLPYLAELAEFFQGSFILVLPLLILWRLFERDLTEQRWSNALNLCAWLGFVAAMLGFSYQLFWLATSPDVVGMRPHPWFWWLPLVLNIIPMAVLALRKNRRKWWVVWAMGLMVMLCIPSVSFECIVIIITSMHRDYMPSRWTLLHRGWLYVAAPLAILVSAALMLWVQRRPLDPKTNS